MIGHCVSTGSQWDAALSHPGHSEKNTNLRTDCLGKSTVLMGTHTQKNGPYLRSLQKKTSSCDSFVSQIRKHFHESEREGHPENLLSLTQELIVVLNSLCLSASSVYAKLMCRARTRAY